MDRVIIGGKNRLIDAEVIDLFLTKTLAISDNITSLDIRLFTVGTQLEGVQDKMKERRTHVASLVDKVPAVDDAGQPTGKLKFPNADARATETNRLLGLDPEYVHLRSEEAALEGTMQRLKIDVSAGHRAYSISKIMLEHVTLDRR